MYYYTSKPSDCFKILKTWKNHSTANHSFTFVLKPKYTLLCFLNSFELQMLRLSTVRLQSSQFSQNISQHFTVPCHYRRFTIVIHLSSFVEDSVKHWALLPLRSEKLLQYSFWRFVDTWPIVWPSFCTHFADILNSQLMYRTTPNTRQSYPDTLISESMVSFRDSPFKFPLLVLSGFLDP